MQEKLITPALPLLMVSHGWLLVGANGASRFTVGGNTGGNDRNSPRCPPVRAVWSTKAPGVIL